MMFYCWFMNLAIDVHPAERSLAIRLVIAHYANQFSTTSQIM